MVLLHWLARILKKRDSVQLREYLWATDTTKAILELQEHLAAVQAAAVGFLTLVPCAGAMGCF